MTLEEKSMRERIIIATIECIETENINNVTIRKIAKLADVNSASINYYFGSKKNLLDETISFSMKQAFNDFDDIIKDPDTDLPSCLKLYLYHYIEGLFRYPAISKMHLYDPFNANDYDGIGIKYFNEFLNEFFRRYGRNLSYPNEEKEILKLKIVHAFSAVLFIGIFPRAYDNFISYDFSQMESQKLYVDKLVDQLFK